MRLSSRAPATIRYLTFPLAQSHLPRSLTIPRLSKLPQTIQSSRQFNTSTTKMSSSFIDAVKSRRTYYQLSHESTIPDSKIHELVNETVKNAPSSFNSQSARVVVLLGDEHTKLWEEIAKPAVKAVAPAEAWAGSEQRLNGFKGAYGTILFYEDPADVAALQEKLPLYADKFPQWSEHTSAIHQYIRTYCTLIASNHVYIQRLTCDNSMDSSGS